MHTLFGQEGVESFLLLLIKFVLEHGKVLFLPLLNLQGPGSQVQQILLLSCLSDLKVLFENLDLLQQL